VVLLRRIEMKKSLWYRTGMVLIRSADWLAWKMFPSARYDYLNEQAGELDDYIHVDNIGEALGSMRER
jgi:hypothetical protein